MEVLKSDIPDFQSIMLPMLRLLENGEKKSLNEVMKLLSSHFSLTEEHLKIKVPSGQMGLFRNRVGWTRSYLKNAGLIYYPERGVYRVTDFGKEFLQTNPKELRIKDLRKMPKYKEWTNTFNQDQKPSAEKSIATAIDNQTPEEVLAETVDQLHKQLATEILDKLKENTFLYFENFVISLLQKMGYGEFRENSAQHTGKTNDGGIDGIIYQDRLGLESVYIQAKRYSNGSVGSSQIRDFVGALSLKGVTKGVFLTTSTFTKNATETAENSIQQKVILINGKELADLAIEFNLGVQVDTTIELKKIDLDFFEE